MPPKSSWVDSFKAYWNCSENERPVHTSAACYIIYTLTFCYSFWKLLQKQIKTQYECGEGKTSIWRQTATCHRCLKLSWLRLAERYLSACRFHLLLFLFFLHPLFFSKYFFFLTGLGLTQQIENVSMVAFPPSKKKATVHHFWESVFFKSLSHMSCLITSDSFVVKKSSQVSYFKLSDFGFLHFS